jgi:hypothetical protein
LNEDVEYQRTCSRDGTVWYVPPDVVAMQRLGARMGVPVGAALLGGALGIVAGTAAAAAEGVKQKWAQDAGRCPQCGSTSYTEVRIRVSRAP